jgi:hypothetical protein
MPASAATVANAPASEPCPHPAGADDCMDCIPSLGADMKCIFGIFDANVIVEASCGKLAAKPRCGIDF